MKVELQRVAPAEIEQRSMEIIASEMGPHTFTQEQLPIVKRCIHTSADFDYVKNLRFTAGAVEAGLARRGVNADFIRLPEGLTRINVKIKASVETEINGQGPAIPAGALEELFRKLERLAAGDVLVLAESAASAQKLQGK